jgi:hypothetical protein
MGTVTNYWSFHTLAKINLSISIIGYCPHLLSPLIVVIEGRIGGKNLEKWIRNIRLPDASLNEKFRRLQRYLIENNQIATGIEIVNVDLSDLAELNGMTEKLDKLGVKIEEVSLHETRLDLRRKAAENSISRLENVSGWVFVEGKFLISMDKERSSLKCVLRHPVNEYLSNQDAKYAISFVLKTDDLEPSARINFSESVGRTIPLRVVGKVWAPVDRRSGNYDLTLVPLAVY